MSTKDWTVFTIDHELKSMSRYCEHDERYEMRFEKKDGTTEEFVSSRAEVETLYGAGTKDESVSHFEKMAMDWYAQKYARNA